METKNFLKNLACAGLIVLALTGGTNKAKAATVNRNSVVQDDIEYYIQTDKAVYNLSENVEVLYRVTNLRDEDVILVFGAIEQAHFRFEKDGQIIWQSELDPAAWAVATEINYLPIKPEESVSFNMLWGVVDQYGSPVELGNYQVLGGLNLHLISRVSVSAPIQIIPEPSSMLISGLVLLMVRKKRQ